MKKILNTAALALAMGTALPSASATAGSDADFTPAQ